MISIPPIGTAMSLGYERHPNQQGRTFGDHMRKHAASSNATLGAGITERARAEVQRATAAGQHTSNSLDIGNLPITAVAHAVVMLREHRITAEIDHINHKLVLSW